MIFHKWIWVLMCGTPCTFSLAQEYIVKTEYFGTHEGLSDQFVTCAVQSKDGILWIGTKDGLNRYDGYDFKEYNTQNSDLRYEFVSMMHMVDDDRLYVYTTNARTPGRILDVQYLDLKTNTFHDVAKDLAVMIDSAATGWMYYWEGILYSRREDSYMKYDFAHARSSPIVFPQGFEWDTRFLYYALDVKEDDEWDIVDLRDPVRVMGIGSHPDPIVSLIPTIGFVKLNGMQAIRRAHLDTVRNLVWYTLERKLGAFTTDGEPVQFLGGESLIDFPRLIWEITGQDRIVVGTESGIYILSVEQARFRNYFVGVADGGVMGAPECRQILAFKDSLYGCFDDGVYVTPLSNPRYIHKIIDQKQPRSIALIDQKSFFVGSSGIYQYDLDTRTVTERVRFGERIPNFWGIRVFDDTVYASCVLGMVVTQLSDDVVTILQKDIVKLSDEGQNIVYNFEPIGSAYLLAVSSAGLFRVNKDLSEHIRIRFRTEEDLPVAFSHFTHIYQDDDHRFWITSLDGGLIRFELRDTTAYILRQFGRDDGVPTNTFYSVYPDHLGSFWSSTDLGVVRLDTSDWTYQFYSEVDGMANVEFNRLSHTVDEAGNLYFGGLNGVTAFTPSEFYKDESHALTVSLRRVEQYSSWEEKVINTTDRFATQGKVVLDPGDNFLDIKVGLDDLFQTAGHQYQYRINAQEGDWNDMPGNHIRLYGLRFGNHLIEIRGKNARGQWAQNTLRIPVQVLRPVFLRWWFILLSAIGFILIMREFWVSRTRRIQEQAKNLEVMVAERTAKISEQATALKHLEEARSRFFANISHELRTPLTLIKAPLDTLSNKTADREQVLDAYLGIMRNNTSLLRERIDDLLMLSQADAGQLNVHETAIRLNPFLERLLDTLRGLAEQKQVRLTLTNSLPASEVILVDRKKLEHILINFITNAIKYSPNADAVELYVDRIAGDIRFKVSDHGPGIPEREIEKVFDRYYQVSKSAGVGLGLALSRELALVMHGSVGAESIVGEGSTFVLTIPYTTASDNEGSEVVEEADALPLISNDNAYPVQSEGVKHSIQILCVEDNIELRKFLLNELNQYHVEACANGYEALQVLDRKAAAASLPDCIVSDIMMPEMDGFELLQRLKESTKFRAIPVIMLTARAGMEDKLRALRIGVDDYISKPFSTEELRLRIENLTGRKAAKTEVDSVEDVPIIVDNLWLQQVEEVVSARLKESNLTMDMIAHDLHLSRSQFFRRLKAYTGLTPNTYLREVRLYKAKELLENGRVGSVKELSAAVGFEAPTYFSKLFQERFGFRPADRL